MRFDPRMVFCGLRRVHFLLLPSQYKRFIELISEKGVEAIFEQKYSAVLTTSIHFYDHTAHNYLQAVCDVLNMKYVGSFSADISDLMKNKGREGLRAFAEDFFESIEAQAPTSKSYQPMTLREFEYDPGVAETTIAASDKRILIVTDAKEHQRNLLGMIVSSERPFPKTSR